MIYFIQAVDGGQIKIGHTVVRDAQERLADFQVGNHQNLAIILELPGGPSEEQDLHNLFCADKIRGEWFRPSEKLMSFIQKTIGEQGGVSPSLCVRSTRSRRSPGGFAIRRVRADASRQNERKPEAGKEGGDSCSITRQP